MVVQAKLKPEEASWDEGVCDFEMTARAADGEVGSVLEEVAGDGEEGITITSRTASVDLDEQCDAAPSPWAAMDRHRDLFAGEEAEGGGGVEAGVEVGVGGEGGEGGEGGSSSDDDDWASAGQSVVAGGGGQEFECTVVECKGDDQEEV